jgi:hypothetical protein
MAFDPKAFAAKKIAESQPVTSNTSEVSKFDPKAFAERMISNSGFSEEEGVINKVASNKPMGEAPADLPVSPKKKQIQATDKVNNMYASYIIEKANENGVPPDLAMAQAWQESRFNPRATGPMTKYGQAKGMFQFIDATAKEYGITDPYDWKQSADAGMRYMKDLYGKYGSWDLALAAYNAGPGNVDSGKWKRFKETTNYVSQIMTNAGMTEETPSTKQQVMDFINPVRGAKNLGKAVLQATVKSADMAAGTLQGVNNLATKQIELTKDLVEYLGVSPNLAMDYLNARSEQAEAAKKELSGFRESAKNVAGKLEPEASSSLEAVRNKVAKGGAQGALYMAQLMTLQRFTGLGAATTMGVQSGLESYGTTGNAQEAITTGAISAGMGKAFDVIGKLELNPIAKAIVSGTVGGAVSTATGSDMEETIAQTALGAVWGFKPNGKPGGKKLEEVTLSKLKFDTDGPSGTGGELGVGPNRVGDFGGLKGIPEKMSPPTSVKEQVLSKLSNAREATPLEGETTVDFQRRVASLTTEVSRVSDPSLSASQKLSLIKKAETSYRAAFMKNFPEVFTEVNAKGYVSESGKTLSKNFSERDIKTGTDFWEKPTRLAGVESGVVYPKVLTARREKINEEIRLDSVVNFKGLIKDSKKNGLSEQDIISWLPYTRTRTQGIVWDESPLKVETNGQVKVNTPAFPKEGKRPTIEQQEVMGKWRAAFDYLQSQSNAEYLPGYVPLWEKIPKHSTGKGKTILGDQTLTFENERTHGVFDPSIHETNPYLLLKRYSNMVAGERTVGKLVPEMTKIYSQLKLLQKDDVANMWLDEMGESMGFQDPRLARRIPYKEFQGQNQKIIDRLSAMASNENMPLFDAIRNSAYNFMYKNVLGMRLKPLIMNELNVPVMASGELKDYKNVVKEWAKPIKSKEDKALIETVKSKLFITQGEQRVLDMPGVGKVPRGLEIAEKIITAPAQPGTKVFEAIEKSNRQKSFLMSYKEFMAEPNKYNYLAQVPMNSGERQIVLDVLKTGNAHAAGVEYGIIKANRINFFQDYVNRPGVFKGKLGGVIPFTSWGSEAWSRYLAVDQGKNTGKSLISNIGKRAAIPAVLLGLLDYSTNTDLATQHPATSGVNLLSPTINPLVGSVVDNFAQGKYVEAGKAGLNWLPAVSLMKKIEAGQKGDVRGMLGLPTSKLFHGDENKKRKAKLRNK